MKSKSFIQIFFVLILSCFISSCGNSVSQYFSGDVSPYPHSNVVNTMNLKGGWYAELETVDSGEKVLEYYKDQMTRSGWSIRVERKFDPSMTEKTKIDAFLAFFKGDSGLMINAYAPENGGKTQIALFMGNTNG
jgi:hypothetical protein